MEPNAVVLIMFSVVVCFFLVIIMRAEHDHGVGVRPRHPAPDHEGLGHDLQAERPPDHKRANRRDDGITQILEAPSLIGHFRRVATYASSKG